MSVFSSPFMLGFDELERMLDHATKTAGDGYPPYNIERVAAMGENGDALRITLAVAGFSQGELEITLEENQLTISGQQGDDGEHDYLHRGIAARQFKRTFVLAEGMIVRGADLENGLLAIDLIRPQPEKIVRNIEIKEKKGK
jgi:HSP20 family molecular chaperone IbpA